MKMMKIFRIFSQIIFPSHCLACDQIVSSDGLFCKNCWLKLQFICEPKCIICSYPFEFQGLNSICGKCLAKKPAFDKVITVFVYNHVLRKVISSLKYNDQTFLAKKFAPLLFTKIKDEISNYDLIVAVPLHIKKLRKRKFNQSILLVKNLRQFALKRKIIQKADQKKLIWENFIQKLTGHKLFQRLRTFQTGRRQISKEIPLPEFFYDFLIRGKNTKTQILLGKKERESNLKNVFAVNKKYQQIVRGKKILLIDDVITTGATAENCARILKKHGAAKVTVLVIAKTIFSNTKSNL
jgi:predicted amidophosphoribosyltransferase